MKNCKLVIVVWHRLIMAFLFLMSSTSVCMSQDSKYELEFSFGIRVDDPVFRSDLKSIVRKRFTGDCAKKYYFDNPSGGVSLNVGFLYNINRTIAIGGILGSYDLGKDVVYEIPDCEKEAKMVDACFSAYYLMPQVAYSWYQHDYITLYSKGALGLKYQHATYDLNSRDIKEDKFRLAYEVIPVGIKLGRSQFKAFMEIGYGMQGFATLGLSVLL